MSLKRVVLNLLLIQVTNICFVRGLQCYVCEDCNEYEDFKELHICGEIPMKTTLKPLLLGTDIPNATTKNLTADTTIHDYLYEDSLEEAANVSAHNSNQKKPTKTTTTKTTTTVKLKTRKPLSAQNTATQTSVTNNLQVIVNEASVEGKTTTTVAPVTATKSKPVPAADYENYLDYEDPMEMDTRSVKSVLKINEPVCYMIKYLANDTVYTNRGCTTFINENKYLTCQTLYNNAPMASCQICLSNGCNKFLHDDDDEDSHGILLNTADAIKYFGVLWLTLLAFIGHLII